MSNATTGAKAPYVTESKCFQLVGFDQNEPVKMFSVNSGVQVKSAIEAASLILLAATSIIKGLACNVKDDAIWGALLLLAASQNAIDAALPALEDMEIQQEGVSHV